MLNFYRRFIPGAAKEQAELNDLLKRPKSKRKTRVVWTEEAEQAFVSCKESLSRATQLTHLNTEAELAVTMDASDNAIGVIVQ